MGSKYHVCEGIFWVTDAGRGRGFFWPRQGMFCGRGEGPRIQFLCSFDPGLRCFDLGKFGVVPRGHFWDFVRFNSVVYVVIPGFDGELCCD